jgi:hypothetical protein
MVILAACWIRSVRTVFRSSIPPQLVTAIGVAMYGSHGVVIVWLIHDAMSAFNS